MRKYLQMLVTFFFLLALPCHTTAFGAGEDPVSVLIINGPSATPQARVDFDWLKELHEKDNLHFDVHHYGRQNNPLEFETLRHYNVLLILNLPVQQDGEGNLKMCTRTAAALDSHLDEGGGVFFMPFIGDHGARDIYTPREFGYLDRLGIKISDDWILDDESEAVHPKHGRTFIYTDNIADSPVTQGVRGIWFPNDDINRGATWPNAHGRPVWPVADEWQAVVRAGESATVKPISSGAGSMSAYTAGELRVWKSLRFNSPDPSKPPALYAVRETPGGRAAITVMNPIYHIRAGTSWIHDGVVVDNGIAGKESDFGRLFVNTLRWLAEPSMGGDVRGGYEQDMDVITHPHFRRQPRDFFPEFDSYQNPTPPRKEVYRGLVGAQSAYSAGTGTVEEWAQAARDAGLDFIVFLEEFTAFNAEKLSELEEECRRLSDESLALIPGFTIRNNVGNYEWYQGFGHEWPPSQAIDEHGRLAMQIDEDGQLTWSAGAPARQWRWRYVDSRGTRNVGYYNFAGSDPGHVPVRNLRLYGMLGVVTYIDGRFTEDITDSYFKLLPQSNTPRICAVSILRSPAEMKGFVGENPYLTHVAANSVADIPHLMRYGHQYGRDNVNLSSGPRIHSWAGTHRVLTYAGESFVTSRYRVPVLAKVTSDTGLSEIRIYRDNAAEGGRLFKRIKLDGEKNYRQLFEWGYDRQSIFVLEAIDTEGGRALSSSFEMAQDGNWHSWCHDRHNGELWHGPFMIAGTWETGVRNPYSVGHTWDGGGSLTRYVGLNVRIDNPHIVEIDGDGERRSGDSRRMEGHTFLTCIDDTVRNIAGEAWNVYAPGRVANSYETWGPIMPSESMRLKVRRTEYLSRIEGPLRDWHAMWAERDGGGMALHSGEVELLRDMQPAALRQVGRLSLVSFTEENEPVWVVRRHADEQAPQVFSPSDGPASVSISPGGYVGVFGSLIGSPSMVVNMSERPLVLRRRGGDWLYHSGWFHSVDMGGLAEESFQKGDKLHWDLLYIYDSLDHEDRSAARMDFIWKYFGLDGRGARHGLEVRQGNMLSDKGMVDLEAEDHVVEFTVPEPEVEPSLDVPVGVRFFGLNPNWTAGLIQKQGYTPGFYSEDGEGLYRNLAMDDKDIAYLGVYTKDTGLTHILAGHPVVAGDEDLRITVTKLSGSSPGKWRVDVNNPTGNRINTVIEVNNMMELGIPLEKKEIDIAPGEFETLLRQK